MHETGTDGAVGILQAPGLQCINRAQVYGIVERIVEPVVVSAVEDVGIPSPTNASVSVRLRGA